MISVFDLFSIGLGPSSSHTVGPMRAGADFASRLLRGLRPETVDRVQIDLFGSLAATGRGHGTLAAAAAGLTGVRPETIDPDEYDTLISEITRSGSLHLGGHLPVKFNFDKDITLRPSTVLARHTNGVRYTARDAHGETIHLETYYSIGGGFIVRDSDEPYDDDDAEAPVPTANSHHPTSLDSTRSAAVEYASAFELLQHCRERGVMISEIMRRNELTQRTPAEVEEGLQQIRRAMDDCVAKSLQRTGFLPGPLKVRRRAKDWFDSLSRDDPGRNPAMASDWVNLVALAVNEENASGGRVVTAPTNGAAGVIPAVLHYAMNYLPAFAQASERTRSKATAQFLLTAAAIGVLFKENASISGAEVGCQGEIGSASSMAAAALTELAGGNPEQVENAAEIALEHNLGLTCDPLGGLVQIPCIERNAIAAVKAINASRMAMRGDGNHHVSLDQAIETMRQTGADMSEKYKETSQGGLAVNVPLC
ncbi:MAG: L-serine ammonia-lyase [Nocardioides sp.]|uniref:L-serine ammonia-lyase n=1 Tax=Nocardioides sp. TaxID=35761 RepID=UPI003D6BF4FD